ncbi:hypothetical protein BHU72_08870 [Desulfuribacillus stibiiarsenatis]|uniref:Uncharacterized protein n=1 Tax=Desulfuribacillus stibiiarsenatis TaxID=1390249 RepID=A0A1E5L3T1_9FIRM|nr:hypothetical protein BHU72_08870 [Desulfuribacillus stibiiarsenatis]
MEAKKAAIFQIVMDMKANEESPWHNKTLKIQEPIEAYDTSDSLYSYLFNLTVDGQAAGFIEVSALKDEYPILSFAREGSALAPSEIAELRQKNNSRSPVFEKVVTLGPAHFGLKRDFPDGSADIISSVETISLSKGKNKPNPKRSINNNARKLWRDIDLVVGDIGSPNDGGK